MKAGAGNGGVISLGQGSILSARSRLWLHPFILGGLTCYIVRVLVWMVALARVDVSVAYLMRSLGFFVNAPAAL